jgi:hypothetical protein
MGLRAWFGLFGPLLGLMGLLGIFGKTEPLGPNPSFNFLLNYSPNIFRGKQGPDALGTTQNKCGSAKHESWTRRPRYRRK